MPSPRSARTRDHQMTGDPFRRRLPGARRAGDRDRVGYPSRSALHQVARPPSDTGSVGARAPSYMEDRTRYTYPTLRAKTSQLHQETGKCPEHDSSPTRNQGASATETIARRPPESFGSARFRVVVVFPERR